MANRIFVRDFSPETTATDVALLIGRMCPVKEVYLPGATPTGWRRSFAIVVVDADSELQQKCIKVFNNSLWKGSRISLEVVRKEYYVDRLNRERAEEAAATAEEGEGGIDNDDEEEEYNGDNGGDDAAAAPELEEFSADVVRIKRSRDGPPLAISTIPLPPHAAQMLAKKKGAPKALPCGCRVVFEYDEHDQVVENAIAPPTPEVAAETAKPKGGGTRRGFGALLAVPEMELALPPAASEAQRNLHLLKGGGTEDRDCCVDPTFGIDQDDSRNFRQNEHFDRYDSDDDAVVVEAPSVRDAELTEVALEKERERSRAVLAALLSKPVAKKVPDKKGAVKDGTIGVSGSSSSSSGGGGGGGKTGTAPADEEAAAGAEGGFAKLDALKSIFHKEGGVWFGDDGTLRETVAKGNVAEDPLFREAEKLGYDIRGSAGAVAAVAEAGKGGAGMMFGFFDEPDTSAPAPVQTAVLAAAVVPDVLTEDAGGLADDDVEDVPELPAPAATTLVAMSLWDIVANANRFCRERPEPEVVQSWRDQRDKLVVDYKRKRKDAKKRSGFVGCGGGGGGDGKPHPRDESSGPRPTAAGSGEASKRKQSWQMVARKRPPKRAKKG